MHFYNLRLGSTCVALLIFKSQLLFCSLSWIPVKYKTRLKRNETNRNLPKRNKPKQNKTKPKDTT